MYMKHFAMTHCPFDNTLEATSLFGAGAQGETEVRLKHLWSCAASVCSPANRVVARRHSVVNCAIPCTRDSIVHLCPPDYRQCYGHVHLCPDKFYAQ